MEDHNEPSLYYLLGTKLPQAVLGVKKQTTAEGYAPTLSLREPWIFGVSTTSSSGSQLSYRKTANTPSSRQTRFGCPYSKTQDRKFIATNINPPEVLYKCLRRHWFYEARANLLNDVDGVPSKQ